MKRKYKLQILTGLLLSMSQLCFAQISFNKSDDWNKILQIAKQQNRYILMDAFATWCEPCKRMDIEVFTNKEAGEYFNKYFISVKVQLDQTPTDGTREKAWSETAKSIKEKYQIGAMPSLLFFTPEGKLAGRSIGYKNADELIDEARNLLEPGKKSADSLALLYYKSELEPFLRTYPSWDLVRNKIKELKGYDFLLKTIISRYNSGIQAGNSNEILVGSMTELQSVSPKSLTAEIVNRSAYALHAMTNDPKQLKIAASWCKQVMNENFSFMDTYASILYKLGQKDEAIKWETKANEISKGHPITKGGLEKMQTGKALLKEYGIPVTGQVNLSGTWILDTAGSDFGNLTLEMAAPTVMKIKQDKDRIDFSRLFGDVKSDESLSVDGYVFKQTLDVAKISRVVTQALDRSIVTVFSDYEMTPEDSDPYKYTREEIYSLTNGGKNLILTRITILDGNLEAVHALYKRG